MRKKRSNTKKVKRENNGLIFNDNVNYQNQASCQPKKKTLRLVTYNNLCLFNMVIVTQKTKYLKLKYRNYFLEDID